MPPTMMQTLGDLYASVGAINVVDILIMAGLVYFVAAWLKGTRAFQIMVSLVVMVLLYFAAAKIGLILTSILFQYLWAAIIVVFAIVFQPEIREMLDRASPLRYLIGKKANEVRQEILDETVRAADELASQRCGALIVFKRTDRISNFVTSGRPLDSLFCGDALVMIFEKKSPLHDGAALVVDGRVQSVGCILPLSKNENLEAHYGTRHRAAVGITERSDALCVVVSEERGEVSLVEKGQITVYRKRGEFRDALERGLTVGRTEPSGATGSLIDLILYNWRLKIVCLLISVSMWFVVVGPHRSELGVSVPIQYTNLGQEMEITGTWMDRVDVRVRGSEAALASLKPGSIRVEIDLRDVVAGPNFFRIVPKNVLVPPGISISEIRPTDLHLNIEIASIKKIGVVPTLVGSMPDKTKVSVTPAEVMVRAVQDELKKVTSVTTEPVSLPDLEARGKIVVPVLVKPDGLKIDVVDPMHVTIALEPEK